ncbi:MAG: AAA family ATPase [Jatrophihabitans sp.]
MPGVTISAGYGAGGSVVAPEVARLLGLPLLDRAISSAVARQLQVTVAEAQDGVARRSIGGRFLGLLTPLAGGVLGAGTDAAPIDLAAGADDAVEFREQAENIMRQALDGGAVILGRAGAAALAGEPRVLRVRLFGPADARIAQAARLEGIDGATARSRLPGVDAARAHYVRRLYRADVDDPQLYHLQLDSTVLSLAGCAEVIVAGYRALLPGSQRSQT